MGTRRTFITVFAISEVTTKAVGGFYRTENQYQIQIYELGEDFLDALNSGIQHSSSYRISIATLTRVWMANSVRNAYEKFCILEFDISSKRSIL